MGHLIQINAAKLHALQAGFQSIEDGLPPKPKASPNQDVGPWHREKFCAQDYGLP
jgi:hypothetical protein